MSIEISLHEVLKVADEASEDQVNQMLRLRMKIHNYYMEYLNSYTSKDELEEISTKLVKMSDDDFVDYLSTLMAQQSHRTDDLATIKNDLNYLEMQLYKLHDSQAIRAIDTSKVCTYRAKYGTLREALELTCSYPTDRVYASKETLSVLVNEYLGQKRTVPSDVILADKVVIPDMEIVLSDERNDKFQPMRVIIDVDTHDNAIIDAGLITVPIMGFDNIGLAFAFGICREYHNLLINPNPFIYGAHNNTTEDLSEVDKLTEGGIIDVITVLLQYWYSIQRMLYDERFIGIDSNKTKFKDRRKYLLGEKMEKTVRSIKTWNITEAKVREMLDGNSTVQEQTS